MAIEFNCSSCLATLRVSEEHLGKQARCPSCQALNTVQPMVPKQGETPVAFMGEANPYAASAPPRKPPPHAETFSTPRATAHRGGLILTMGIMSIVCNLAMVPGILAWVLGRADLKKMRAGYMDRSGEGITQAGMIIGIIMTVMGGISILLMFLYFFVAIFFVGLSAAAGQ